jgi:hypothetical protein
VRELFEDINITVGNENENHEISVLRLLTATPGVSAWDITEHPPQNITEWPLLTYSDTKGLKSRTLYAAGWFPSARIAIVAPGDDIDDFFVDSTSAADKYEDYQYNSVAISRRRIRLQA